jgi:hypothetical protein
MALYGQFWRSFEERGRQTSRYGESQILAHAMEGPYCLAQGMNFKSTVYFLEGGGRRLAHCCASTCIVTVA